MMKLATTLLNWLLVLILVLPLAGCIVKGHRKLSIEVFGQNLTIEDNVFPNSEGEQVYTSTFDEPSWDVIGHLFKEDTAQASLPPNEPSTP